MRASNAAVDDVPDPDEDDLDDLDDLLDEFSTAKIDKKSDAPLASGPGRPSESNLEKAGEASAEEFSKQLQEQMAALMGELDESPEMRKQFEDMMKGLDAHPQPAQHSELVEKSGSPENAQPPSAAEDQFQETIRKTMERMQASGDQTQAAMKDESNDILEQMMEEIQGNGSNAAGSEEDLSKMLMGMMEQLTNKDILYEPMKELHEKFPGWMNKNKDGLGSHDLQRYIAQQSLVEEIVRRFERNGYSDESAADREFIVGRMQKMQAAGSPPPDLVGDTAFVQEALGDLDSGCAQQ